METSPTALTPESLLSSAGFVRNLARSLLRDPHSADDVAQETLLTAMQKPPRSEQGLRGWLASVVRSVVRNTARGDDRRKWRETSAARAESTPSAAEILEREALRGTVVQAVLGLSEPSRSAVLLRYYEDKAPREIARLQGVPVETVRTRIKRGLAELRRELDVRLGQERGGWAHALLPLAMASARGSAALLPMSVGLQVAAGAGLLLLGAGGWHLFAGRTRTTAPLERGVAPLVRAELGAPSSPALAGEASAQARQPVARAAALDERELTGSVSDPRGKALAGAILYVSPDGPPPARFRYHPEWLANLEQKGLRFAFSETEASGRFRAEFQDFQRVYVAVVDAKDAFLWADPLGGRWLDLPSRDVAFQVADAPTAEVVARVRVEPAGQPVLDFTCGLRRTSDGLVLASVRARSGSALCKVPFHPTLVPDEFDLVVEDARLGRASTRVGLAPGERREVELLLQPPVELTGQVVDPSGAAVDGALVCSGTGVRLRGDEPFKPFDPARVKDGALTDAGGWFTLAARERYVTVWHAGWSPRTVKREEAALVLLEPRSILRGRLLAPDGGPMSGATITLDREREALTDELGRFAFESVEAGVRGLRLPSRRLVSVVVPPGETLEIDLSAEPGLAVAVSVLRGGLPWLEELGGVGVGIDPISEIFEFGAEDGLARLGCVRPGRYVLLTSSGDVATVELTHAGATVELGTTPLFVRAAPGTRVYVVPAGSNELVEVMAGRVASRTVPAEGVLSYRGLPRGRHGVGIDRQGVQLEVELADAPVEVRLE